MSMKQNDEKFDEIGEEQVKREHREAPQRPCSTQTAPKTHPKRPESRQNLVYYVNKAIYYVNSTLNLDLPSPKRTPQGDEDRPAPGWCRLSSLR